MKIRVIDVRESWKIEISLEKEVMLLLLDHLRASENDDLRSLARNIQIAVTEKR